MLQRRSFMGRSASAPWGAWFGLAGIMFAAVLVGAATALFGQFAAIGVSVLVIGLFALSVPLAWLVSVLYLVSFVITGQLIYFARFDKALWFPFLIGAVLLVRYPGELLARRVGTRGVAGGGKGAFQFALIVYFFVVIASSVINRIGPLQAVVTAKEYFFLWGVYLVVGGGLLAWAYVRRLWLLLPWLMLAQLPLVLYQRFVVLPSRAERHVGAEWDAVVGAFGGNPEGGGSSGAMGVFCVCAMAFVMHAWRSGQMPRRRAFVLLAAGFACIALAEVKFAVLLLPVVFGAVFLHHLIRRPLQGIGLLLLSLVLSLGILTAYKAQYAISQTRTNPTLAEYFDSMFSSSVNNNFTNLRTGEIGRVAAIGFWWQQHGAANITQTLIGHGMGASRSGNLVVGEAARRWPFDIARSALAILLWETGLLGTAAMVFTLLAAAWRAHRLAGARTLDALDRSLAAVSCAVCLAVLAGLIYNTDLYYSHQTQLLLMLALGLQVRLGRGTGAGPAPARPAFTPGLGAAAARP